jgi:hypothetical protein
VGVSWMEFTSADIVDSKRNPIKAVLIHTLPISVKQTTMNHLSLPRIWQQKFPSPSPPIALIDFYCRTTMTFSLIFSSSILPFQQRRLTQN